MKRILKTILPLFIVNLAILSASAQGYKRNKDDVFPLSERYRLGGLVVGAGITYMQGYNEEKEFFNYADSTTLSSMNYYAKPKGQIGAFAEVGWFHSFKYPTIFEFMDFGLSYKWLRGKEEFREQAWVDNNMIAENVSLNTFSDHTLSGNINFTSVIHTSENNFVTNAIGANVDYVIAPGRGGGRVIPGRQLKFPDLYAQLHYKLGFGWRLSEKILMIPTLETPILGIYPFTHIKSTLDYFNTRQRPFLLSLRFMFIRERTEDCPPVYNPMGLDPSQYRNRKSE